MVFKMISPSKNLKPFLVTISERGSEEGESGIFAGDKIFNFPMAGVTTLRPSFSTRSLNLNFSEDVIEERSLKKFYLPYYDKIGSLLNQFKGQFGERVFLLDVNVVANLGNEVVINSFSFSSPHISEVLYKNLLSSKVDVARDVAKYNHNIIRKFGNPSKGTHAIQMLIDEGLVKKSEVNENGYTKVESLYEQSVALMYEFGKNI
jgi:hypothetical protein